MQVGRRMRPYALSCAAAPTISFNETLASEGDEVELGDAVDMGVEDENGIAASALESVHTETVVAFPGNSVSTRTTLPMRPSANCTMRRSFII